MSKRIGLTGNIGSGKSTVADLLQARGAALIDSDVLAREASQDPEVLAAISARIAPNLVRAGRLDRQATAALVFDDPEALQRLNDIIHPWVRRESARRVESLLSRDEPPAVILLDIPLLFENGLESGLDGVVVVDAPLDLRIERVKRRSGLSEADLRARDKAQMPLAAKVARADYVIDNSRDLAALEAQVAALWQKLTAS